MRNQTYEDKVKDIIISIENFKENNIIMSEEEFEKSLKYNKKEVELLELEIQSQQKTVDDLKNMAHVAASTDISFSNRMLEAGDRLRELQTKLEEKNKENNDKLAEREKVEQKLEKKKENLSKYISNLEKNKEEVKKQIDEATSEITALVKEIKQLKLKENKTTEEIDHLNYIMSEKTKKFQIRKDLREKLGEINKALKISIDYQEKGIIPENKKNKDKKPGDKEADGKKPGDKEADGKKPGDKEADGKKPGDKEVDGKNPVDKEADGKKQEDKEADGKKTGDKEADGKKQEDKEADGKKTGDKEEDSKKQEDKKGIDNNDNYKEKLEQYKKLLAVYKEELDNLYIAQNNYEIGSIEYSEYKANADYMVKRYQEIMEEYKKILNIYNKEKSKGVTENSKGDKKQWHPDLTEEQIMEAIQRDIYEPEGQEYEQYLKEFGLDYSKQPIQKEQDPKTKWHSKLTEEQIMEAIQRDIYEPEGQEYEQFLAELGLKPEDDKNLKGSELEKPEEPEKPIIIKEKTIQTKEGTELPKEFDQILDIIGHAENTMTDAEFGRYESAKGNWLVPVKYDKGDWLHNTARFLTQTVLGNIINVPRKLYSMIRTSRKQKEKVENITKNVDELSPEDFKVLCEGLETYEGHTNLVSAPLRKAVLTRATREANSENAKRNEEIIEQLKFIKKSHERAVEIAGKLKEEGLSEEERNILIQEKMQLDAKGAESIKRVKIMRNEAARVQGGLGIHGLEEEDKAAREGSNLAGRKFGRRTSNDVELQHKQAELSRLQVEARAKGDNFGEVDAFVKHEELLEENTFTKKIMGITVSRGQRNHSTGVFTKEYKEDDLMRNLATIATVTATTINMIKQIQNQMALAEHNAKMQQADIANQQMAAKGEQLRQEVLNNEGVINKGIEGTDSTRTAAAWGIGHEGAATPYDFTGGWGSKDLDKMFHQVINGNVTDQTLKDFITQGAPAIKAYAQAHPQFDYTALLESMEKLGNGGIEAITQYNNAVKGVVQLAKDMGEITSTSVGTLALSPTYIETMIPLIMTGKTVTSKEYRKALKEVKKKEKQENKKNFKKDLKVKSNKEDENKRNNATKEEHTNINTKESIEVNSDDGREV